MSARTSTPLVFPLRAASVSAGAVPKRALSVASNRSSTKTPLRAYSVRLEAAGRNMLGSQRSEQPALTAEEIGKAGQLGDDRRRLLAAATPATHARNGVGQRVH